MSKHPGYLLFIVVALVLAGCTTTTPPRAPAETPAQLGAAPEPSPAPPVAANPVPAPPATENVSVTAPAPRPAFENPVPATPSPAPPAADTAPATIRGSEETSTMLDNFTAFVVEIDGVPVAAGREGWNTALPLRPGVRRLTLGFKRGVFTSQAMLELNVQSRAAYQVQFASDAELFGKNSYCEFWVVNTASGQPATPRVRSGLVRVEAAK